MLATRRSSCGPALHTPPQIEQGIEIVILLVAVERDVIGPGNAVKHCRDFGEAPQVGVRVAADLELEEGVAIGRNDLLQRFRETVIDLARLAGNDVHQADRVARGDARAGCQLREETLHVEAGQLW